MLALALAIAATVILTPPACAQNNYTVWSSVILTRTGDRTPEILGDIPTKLTSMGANQAFAAGTYFRNRYIVWQNGTDGIDSAGAPLRRLDPNVYDDEQVYALTLDQQWNSATAQAFLQGFYPAFTGTNETGDLTSRLGNGTYVTGPLGGYQYPLIQTPRTRSDPLSIYLDAAAGCKSFEIASYESLHTQQADATRKEFSSIYNDMGGRFLGGAYSSDQSWTYENAYAIYDYLRYKYEHDEDAPRQLNALIAGTNTSYISIMKQLADQQLYAKYGDLNANNTFTGEAGLPGDIPGSISTVSGNFFMTEVLDRLADAASGSSDYQPLNLYFGDLATFMSFFALTDLPSQSSEFVS